MYGSSSPYVYRDIGGVDIWSWYVIANLFAMASVCPFFGSVADLIGRRYVALLGSLLVVIGMIVCSTARRMPVFIAGMAISGSGSGICELIALAVIAEQSPAKDRGKYATILVFSILPFTPSILWAQLIASKAGWRYIGALCGAMAAAAFVMTALFFRPPPTLASRGLSKRERFRRIDFLGGGLFIGGVLLVRVGVAAVPIRLLSIASLRAVSSLGASTAGTLQGPTPSSPSDRSYSYYFWSGKSGWQRCVSRLPSPRSVG
jgi:MFS family permease